MGFLTDDMVRLRSEISGLRAVRKGLSLELVQDAKVRKDAVAAMGKEFHNAHAEMAKVTKRDRLTFLSGIKDSVSSLQEDFHKDLAGIRRCQCQDGQGNERRNPCVCIGFENRGFKDCRRVFVIHMRKWREKQKPAGWHFSQS